MDKYSRRRFTEYLNIIAKQAQIYARYVAWQEADVDDIFQTALLNAYRKFSTFKEGTNFKAWIFRFITNAAYNINRRSHNIGKSEITSEDGWDLADSAIEALNNEYVYEEVLKTPEAFLSRMDAEVKEAVKKIPLKRRNIFLLRSVAELTYSEIADILEIPIGTVMGELARARRQLRETLCQYVKDRNLLKGKVN